jgi:hypothetical protein
MPETGSQTVAESWRTVQENVLAELLQHDFRRDESGLRFIRPHAADIAKAVRVPVFWSPVPRRLTDCLGPDGARTLCDWTPRETAGEHFGTMRGGREYHTEYCEYAVVLDAAGRPKRVEITTELREWWLALARCAPDLLRREAAQVLYGDPEDGRVGYPDLYGDLDPLPAGQAERGAAFQRQVAGSELNRPRQAPQGRLNRDHALFMAVPINGLDDLLWILLLGARRFARAAADGSASDRPAPLPWLLLDNPYYRAQPEAMASLAHLYGTQADPAVLRAVQLLAWENRQISADPLAAVLSSDDFALDRLAFPAGAAQRWVRWSRPAAPGLYQRLVIGPGDDEPETLADIQVLDAGGAASPLTGGFQLLELLATGIVLAAGPRGTVGAVPEALRPVRTSIHDPNRNEAAELVPALAAARAGLGAAMAGAAMAGAAMAGADVAGAVPAGPRRMS